MVVGCQPESVSAPDIELGLTKSVDDAIPEAIEIILNEIEV
jgi:coenzyme F420 hydrogenase subunit delta